ncbi:adenylyl-sulfate kinase [Desulfovibrio sp. TomC]|uniref:adenylyl-sulfate kinase n=1 Tax=Desulfovibrio sp. TomC TaxID=1562888 RepID=UPI000574BB13|nr:adenylyl-sulfate kinase [Desulfovibrio sp. TomC]KHK00653.1 Sulfate adenylyltransferase [Desulfovibrio sp. TomC]
MESRAQNLLVHFRQAEELKAASVAFPSYSLREDQLLTLELLLSGALFPLTGYLSRADYDSVLAAMRLADGQLMPMPATLDVPAQLAQTLAPGSQLALRDGEGFMLAVVVVSEVFEVDPAAEARTLFAALDLAAHPGARAVAGRRHPWLVAGEVCGLSLPQHPDCADLRLPPAAVQANLAQRGWRSVVACQFSGVLTEPERASFAQAAGTIGARLLLLRTVGDALAGGTAHFTGVRCARLAAAAFPRNTAQLALLPLPVLTAGPRQALFEAVIHHNLGASHTLVAPEHADPFAGTDAPFYPRQAAFELVRAHAGQGVPTAVAAVPMAYDPATAGYVPADTAKARECAQNLDAAELTRRLEYELDIPAWYLRPEIAQELRQARPPRARQGLALFMTGLSGAGKSTLAKHLYVLFMELGTRPVSLLDGDIVRRHLSSELTFTREHRELNIARIGYVASEIAKNGGIAICAPIAPYAAGRLVARNLVSPHGAFIEIHVATPLAVCEQRDRKGLYAKARAGLVKGVTGIDDPYEAPLSPEIHIDTSELGPSEAAQDVLLYLEREGYLK